MLKAFKASSVFNGDVILHDHTVLLDAQGVVDVLPSANISSDVLPEDLGDGMIAPGFVDAQVYGAGGKLLSAQPSVDTLETMRSIFLAEGTVYFQPTIATNSPEVFSECITAVRAYMKSDDCRIPGIHLEGPWINALKKGAHLEKFIHQPTLDEVKNLLRDSGDVISMITLAPECCSNDVIQYLIEKKYPVIAAGHSNMSFEEAANAFSNGIGAVTHLYNAMSPLQHRAPGIVGAVFLDKKAAASIIPDGYHVDFAAIRIAKQIMGSRLYAITDAVTETVSGPYPHTKVGDKYEAGGILSGSAISMHKAFLNLVQHVGIEVEEAHRMCSLYPARVLQKEARYGTIRAGASANLLFLDQKLNLKRMINGWQEQQRQTSSALHIP